MPPTELDELLEARLAGGNPAVPERLRADFDRAVAGYEALRYALDETIAYGGTEPGDRPAPELPTDYEIVRKLGRGGMGVVYLVRQKSLGRLVAVKVLRPGEAAIGRMVRRFLDEARHLARLRHPNIVSVHEVGRAGDEPYFTMDYVEGEPLSAMLARGRLSPSQALALWKQAAEAIHHAHAHGIIHRDLKPGNVLVDALGRAYVTDFGLARDMTQASTITGTGEVMGTPAYMAPEQAHGQIDRIGEATDVHALGVLLYEMLTGVAPYGKDAPARVLARLLNEDAPPPRSLDKRIPRELETICLKATAKDPARRYATVRGFHEDICRFEAGTPVQARRPGLVPRAARLVKRHWRIGTATGVTAAVALALAVFFFRPSREDLLVAGDEKRLAGQHAEAVRLFRRSLQVSWGFDRVGPLERIVRCAREMGDRAGAVDAALDLLQWDPTAWFGELDLPVAQAVLDQQRPAPSVASSMPVGVSFVPQQSPPNELALHRFEMFLYGPEGTESERRAAEQSVARLRQSLGKPLYPSLAAITPLATKSADPPETLLKTAEDGSLSVLQRTIAAHQAGVERERTGDAAGALSAYRRAFDLLRSAHPVSAGITRGIESLRPRSLRELREPQILRRIAEAIRRLETSGPERLRGGLRFRISGVDLSPDVGLTLAVSLWNPDAPDPGRGTETIDGQVVPATLGDVPVQLDQTGWVGVADGVYRLAVRAGSRTCRASGHARRQFDMLHFDFGELPDKVEVRGSTIDLPPIQARLVDVVALTGPAENSAVDPRKTVLRREAFPLAQSHKATVWRTRTTPGGGTFFEDHYSATTAIPSLPLADLPLEEAQKLGFSRKGTTGAWSVEAFDAQGRWIARSRSSRSFVVEGASKTPE